MLSYMKIFSNKLLVLEIAGIFVETADIFQKTAVIRSKSADICLETADISSGTADICPESATIPSNPSDLPLKLHTETIELVDTCAESRQIIYAQMLSGFSHFNQDIWMKTECVMGAVNFGYTFQVCNPFP